MEPLEKKQHYSKFLLRPNKLEMREAYNEYLREEVRTVMPLGSLIIGLVTLVFLVMSIVKGEFKEIAEKNIVGPNLMFFFMASALFFSISICYLLSKKYS